jgi:site-specific DNA recombinase
MILGYTRISSVKQQDGHSLDYQKQKINEYCSLKELPITEVFSEVDSGGNDDRIILSKVKKLISLGQVKCVVVWKLDRLSRSMLGGLQFIQFCKEHDTRVVCISDNLDSGNESSELMINILLSIAQEERRQIKTRCNMGRNMMWKNNQIPYPKIPFGYTRKNDTLVLNEDSKTVEYIFRKYNVLAKMKHLTKRQRTERLIKLLERNNYTFNGKKFRWWNVRDILSQTLYSGSISWKGEIKQSHYPTVISKRLFNQVQMTLK